MATAELAVILPAVLLVVVLALWSLMAVFAHLACLDAASAGARALARGDSPAAVRSMAGLMAPEGAEISLGDEGGLVVVAVRSRVALPGPWRGSWPGVQVGGVARAVAETGTAP